MMNRNKEIWKDLLIIDDEQLIIDSLSKICELENYSYDSVNDAEDAKELILSKTYRLLICDIMMPKMDGFQFIEYLRDKNIITPIVITTGYSTFENAVRSLKQGAIGFIPKPFSVDEIISVIRRSLEYSKIMDHFDCPEKNGSVLISSPPKYFRLGYSVWANLDKEGTILIGVTSLFVETIVHPVTMKLEEPGEFLTQGKACIEVSAGDDTIHTIYCPISGKILEVNPEINISTDIILKDPYFKGWIYRIIPNDLDNDFKNLLSCSSDRF